MSEILTEGVADVRMDEAKMLMKKGEYEDAIGLFSSLLQAKVEEFGELSLEASRAYYEYGNALLVQQEENPSDGLLGGHTENSGSSEVVDEEVESDNDVDNDESGDDKKDDSDLQIAWENLDVARLILEKATKGNEGLLSSVYIRLGDLMRLEERPSDAAVEYEKARVLRELVFNPSDRELCDVYFCLATAYVDLSAKVEESEVHSTKRKALDYYEKARRVLELQICSGLSEDLAEAQDLVDILSESIDALAAELQVEKPKVQEPVTTIGFGSVTSSSSSQKRSGGADDIQVLQMKKKPKTS